MVRAAPLAVLACLVVLVPAAGAETRGQLHAALARGMGDAGGQSGAIVRDLDAGTTMFALHASRRSPPASNEKLYTSATALLRLGPAARFATVVRGNGFVDADGVFQGNLYLRGFGDPTFGSTRFVRSAYGTGATVEALAQRLIDEQGIDRVHGSIFGDESWFDIRRGPHSGGIDPDGEGELSALAFNRGLANEQGTAFAVHPAAFSAVRLRATLRADHVSVTGQADQARTPAAAEELARVTSPPLSTLLRLQNQPSDNFFAEMLAKQLGRRFDGAGTTAAGAAVVRAQLAKLGIHASVVDGSGLSRANLTSPAEIERVLEYMHGDPTGPVLEASIPVAGRTGTLAGRMRGTAAQGRCHAKTGTLSDVSALSGYCHTVGGHLLAFSFLMNHANVYRARSAQDRMAAAIARYG